MTLNGEMALILRYLFLANLTCVDIQSSPKTDVLVFFVNDGDGGRPLLPAVPLNPPLNDVQYIAQISPH